MKITKRIAAVLAAAVMSCTAVAPLSVSAAKEKPSRRTTASDSTGKTGFSKSDGKYYYYKDGKLVKNSFIKYNEKYYYFLSDGQMATSWVKINGTYYRFGTDGIMYTGWKKIDEKWYYFGTDGKMRTGTVTIGEKNYTFSSAGVWDGKAGTTASAASSTAKKSVDYTCTKDDIIAIKGLKDGQYTYNSSKNILYYRSKFLGKDAVTYYYFENGKLAFYATGILNFNLSESDMQSAYNTLVDTFNKSFGKSVLSYTDIQGEVWQSGKNYVIAAYTNGVVMSMNLSESYMEALSSGKASMPDFSDL